MQLAICTDVFADLSYTDMLDKVKSYGIDAVEMTAGGWGARKHCPTAELLADENKLAAYKAELEKRSMRIAALNTSCNPLWPNETGKTYSESMYDCATLAGKLGVKKLVAMSGLPAGNEHDTTPNWIVSTVSWPDYMAPAVEYQWKTTIAWWKDFAAHCEKCGVEQVAIEEFPCMMVYNVESLLRLREAVGPMIGMNLDPSHLIVMGADPIAAARALRGCIYHVHGKDARVERGVADINTLLEPKPVTECAARSWNYVAVGCGQDLKWWKEFFSVLSMMGYHGDVSLEMEDLTMSVEAGVATSVDALRQTISQ
ncbi:sugar phosphate isomerase/epimerase family protein [Agathobaculum sp.]|uniref:sugar phosphate isomerase/epimerase family protein n=1 Tax=Agathobaculum sp. TaxID=2048138 RepID=UPI002A7FEF45|nr:sugar phosphate isomerase/epimerase [Agathobaculum sp.]MDY3618999.1 sugar phosphate isomerase/epimerase [Agathobaculum sp.]